MCPLESSVCHGIAAARGLEIREPSSTLLIRNRQEDTIVDGNRAGEERGCVRARDDHVPRIAAQSRTSGLRNRCNSIARLQRNASRLRRAVRGAKTSIADKHLAEAAVGAGCGGLRLGGNSR